MPSSPLRPRPVVDPELIGRAEALRVYSTLCVTLREELGISPSAASQAVYDDVLPRLTEVGRR